MPCSSCASSSSRRPRSWRKEEARENGALRVFSAIAGNGMPGWSHGESCIRAPGAFALISKISSMDMTTTIGSGPVMGAFAVAHAAIRRVPFRGPISWR